MNTIQNYTFEQVQTLIDSYRKLFQTVRLVTPEELRVLSDEHCPTLPHNCFFCAETGVKCHCCVSLSALRTGTVQTKLEYLKGVIYQVMALPIRIDGSVHVVEMLRRPDENFLNSFTGRFEIQKELADNTYKLNTDVLTGAYSRRYYEEYIRDLRSPGTGVAIMDVDDFKLYNDFLGHKHGDSILCSLVEIINNNLRTEDRLIRYGGDEFLLILPRTDEAMLSDFLNRLRKKIVCADIAEKADRLSVSIGGVISGEETISDAVERADRLLLLAKQQKNRVMTGQDTLTTEQRVEKPTVLITDDSKLNREILSAMLGDEFHILEAWDGESCIQVLRTEGARISLCLLDIIMPEKDGFDVLAYMNETHLIEEVPVIIITGDDSTASIRRAYDLGVSDYINRPFDSEVVRRRTLNTIKLYAKQRRLASMLSNRMLEKEENAKVIIDIFSHAVEFRNTERGSHVLNISRMTRILLEQLVGMTDKYPLSSEEIDVISIASMLHDIGKIGIAEEILNKPDKLTPDEIAIIRRHTLIGAKILEDMKEYRDLPLVQTAIVICRWHHERWDGGGYPDGLKGDEIPIAAQVAALADCYDALVSKRSYKETYSHEETIRMILSGECGAFNPLLYDCLQKTAARIK